MALPMPDSEIPIREFTRVLRRWRLLLGLAVAGAAAGAGFSLAGEPAYRAAATLRITPDIANPAPLHTLIENVAVATDISRAVRLAERAPGVAPERLLSGHVRVEDVWAKGMLRIHVTLADPRLAQEVANAFAERAVADAHHLQPPPMAQVDSLRQRRDAAAEALVRARLAILGAAADDETREIAQLSRLVELEGEEAAVSRAEFELGQPLDPGAIRLLTARRIWLNEEIARRRARMAVLQRELIRFRTGAFGAGDTLANKRADERRAITDYESAKQLHASLAIQYEQSLQKAAAEQVRLTLIEPAPLPSEPISRQSVPSALLGAIGGIIVGVFVGLGLGVKRFAGLPNEEVISA